MRPFSLRILSIVAFEFVCYFSMFHSLRCLDDLKLLENTKASVNMTFSYQSASICVLFRIGMLITFTLAQDFNNCTNIDLESIELHVNVGWPFHIDCDPLILAEDYTVEDYVTNNSNLDSDDILICQIYNLENNSLLLNDSFISSDLLSNNNPTVFIDDIKINETYRFESKFFIPKLGKCYTHRVTLIPTPFKQATCEQYLKTNFLQNPPHSDTEAFRRFDCKVPSKEHWNVPKINQRYNITSTWLRNCSHLPSNLSVNSDRELPFLSVTFDHAGVYTCAISYNGMTRYIKHKQICVKQNPSRVQQSIKCVEDIYAAKNAHNVTLKCTLRLGQGKFTELEFFSFWDKLAPNGSIIETFPCKTSSTASSDFSDTFCYYEYNRSTTANCYNHIASEEERNRMQEFVFIYLTFRKISSTDFGTYLVTANTIQTNTVSVNDTILLQENIFPQLLKTAEIIGIVVGIVAFLIILILILIIAFTHWILHFQVYYKRYLGGYEIDDKEYGAYLSYHFSNELDKFAQDDISVCVKMTCDMLQHLGYKVYDEHRDFNLGMRAENLDKALTRSHRVAIVLTTQYIKNDWSMRNLQQAFQKMIESKSKLIFVLLPGIKEYLKQHAAEDDICRLIRAAVRLNYAIYWSGDKKFNSKVFKMQFENAMPKLESQKSQNMSVSDTSSQKAPFRDSKGYQHCFSTNTQTSEVFEPKSIFSIIEESVKFDNSATKV